jgi:hypothetical protein
MNKRAKFAVPRHNLQTVSMAWMHSLRHREFPNFLRPPSIVGSSGRNSKIDQYEDRKEGARFVLTKDDAPAMRRLSSARRPWKVADAKGDHGESGFFP